MDSEEARTLRANLVSPRTGKSVWQLNLRHLQLLVVYAAVALACLTPITRARDGAIWPTALVTTIILPFVLALVTRFLIRPGPLKEMMMILWFLFLPILELFSIFVVCGFSAWYEMGKTWRNSGLGLSVIVTFTLVSVLLFGFLIPWAWLFPGRCPNCRRRSVFPVTSPRERDATGPAPSKTCLACEFQIAGSGGRPNQTDA